ncbi:MacS family sensor histidine kinase [Saccharopolyspora taberi]|uniref:DUF5931 domain-containing protein n=1 Tax=Saccharopolyspora taberi TaxID=60895 RepID=A0ABN3VNB8_9PSEU
MAAARTTSSKQGRVTDGRSPIWRAHNAFRVVTLLYAGSWFVAQYQTYVQPELAAAIFAVMVVWTVYTIWRYRLRSGRTNRLVLIDQLLVTALVLLCDPVHTDQQMADGLPSVVSLWHSSSVTCAAAQWGMIGGGISGVTAALLNFLVRWTPSYGWFADASMAMDTLLLVGTGLLLGLASDTARRSTERLARALRAEAATAERERLARSIHDSVLQVLARVRRRGQELGGEAAELAKLAGEQEIKLRSLVSMAPPEPNADGETDLAARLHVLRTPTTQVSVPATPVLLPEQVSSDLEAVVREALANVERHAGPDAKAWVLLEDLPDEIVLSIRDDGPGIPEGRLDEAAAEGRMGVAQSIQGRISTLGGSITLDTAPGEGTEWEVRVPRGDGAGPAKRREGGQR